MALFALANVVVETGFDSPNARVGFVDRPAMRRAENLGRKVRD